MNSAGISYAEIVQRVGAPVVAVVFCAETYNGLAVTRALGKMGVPIYALGEAKDCITFYSRYATECVVYPDPVDHPEEFLKTLLNLGAQLQSQGKKAVLFPTSDRTVKIISRNHAALSAFFIVHVPSQELLEQCLDKETQCLAARATGVPCPQTYTQTEVEQLFSDLDQKRIAFPLIFKCTQPPQHYSLNRKFRVVILEKREKLDEILRLAAAEKISFLVQDVIPGGDDQLYTLGSCMNRAGELKAIFTGRKLRQKPPRFGICRVGESKYVEDLIRDGATLLRALKFFGTSQIEFKYDCRDGKYKLIEVNPRSWSWIGLPIEMGINIPYATFCDSLGLDNPTMAMPNDGKQTLWISLSDDLHTSLAYKDGTPWKHLFQGYDRVIGAYYAPYDRKPGLIHGRRTLREYAGQAARKLGWRRGKKT